MNKVDFKRIAESLRDWGHDFCCCLAPGMDSSCLKRFKWRLAGLRHGHDHKYICSHLGFNLRITAMQAAEHSKPSWYGFPIAVPPDAPFTGDELVRHLNDEEIGTRRLFGGNLASQVYKIGREFRPVGDLPKPNLLGTNTFWAGLFAGFGQPQLDYVLDVVLRFRTGRMQGYVRGH